MFIVIKNFIPLNAKDREKKHIIYSVRKFRIVIVSISELSKNISIPSLKKYLFNTTDQFIH